MAAVCRLRFLTMRINEAVGAFLRDYRKEHGYTLEQIATASQRYGSGWSSGTLSLMERGGSKADALPNLLILVQTLSDLDGADDFTALTIGSVFSHWANNYDDDIKIDITDTVTVDGDTLGDWLDSGAVNLNAKPVNDSVPYGDDGRPLGPSPHGRQLRRVMELKDMDDEAIKRINRQVDSDYPFSASEVRAAGRLGITPYTFHELCLVAYGHGMDEENRIRNWQADATPQKRGRVTRQIVAELQQLWESADETDDGDE